MNEIKKRDVDIQKEYLKLMKGEITNRQFEEATGLEPTEDNPSRADWAKRQNI